MNIIKRATLGAFIQSEPPTLIQVDGRACDVPLQHRVPQLTLRIGLDLQPHITELDIGPDALIVSLAFAGVAYRCRIPWEALFAAQLEGVPESQTVWPNSFPSQSVEPAPSAPASPPKRGHLRSV